MPFQRYLDAIMLQSPAPGMTGGVAVMVPLPESAPDVPEVLQNPLPGLRGIWRRVTPLEVAPPRYRLEVQAPGVVP